VSKGKGEGKRSRRTSCERSRSPRLGENCLRLSISARPISSVASCDGMAEATKPQVLRTVANNVRLPDERASRSAEQAARPAAPRLPVMT